MLYLIANKDFVLSDIINIKIRYVNTSAFCNDSGSLGVHFLACQSMI